MFKVKFCSVLLAASFALTCTSSFAAKESASGGSKGKQISTTAKQLVNAPIKQKHGKYKSKKKSRDLGSNPQVEALKQSAGNKLDAGDNAGAESDYTAALAIDPNDIEALTNRGLARYGQGKFGDAIDDVNKAIQIESSWYMPYYVKGMCQLAMGDPNGALESLKQACYFGSHDEYCFTAKAKVEYSLQKYDDCIADENWAVHVNPHNYEDYLWRGLSYIQDGQLDLAGTDAQKLIEIDPSNGAGYFVYAEVLKYQGDKQGAIAQYMKASEVFKASGDANLSQHMVAEAQDLQNSTGQTQG